MPSQPSSLKPKANHSFIFAATGTQWTVEIYDSLTPTVAHELEISITKRVSEFEAVYSRFKPDSFVSQLASDSGVYELPHDAPPLLDMYWALYQASQGAVTPLIGQTLVDAGYDPDYSFQAKPELHVPPHWEDTFTYSKTSHTITMKQAAQLDFGAVGKGYLVDIIAGLLGGASVQSYVVDAGGDMYVESADHTLTIGLEDPDNSSAILGTAIVSQGALCGSAGNRRRWGNYHHIIDPASRQSPEHIRAVWVYADSAMLADGLTTSLFLVPPAILQKQFAFEYILVMDTHSIEMSPGFPGTIFT